MNNSDWPTPCDLADNPELAVLAVLDTALHLSIRALVAAHPQLEADAVPFWRLDRSRPFLLAGSIVSLAQMLSDQLEQYRTLLLPEPPGAQQEDDITF
jgi:hypothetical protein